MDELNKLVDERLGADKDFNTRISTLSDNDKAVETEKRRKEILAEEFQKRDTIAKDQKARAEKAEKERDEYKSKVPNPDPNGAKDELSSSDIYVLNHQGVHPDDVEIVKKGAKLLGLDIKGALNDPMVQAQLAGSVEKRKSANAQHGGGGRGGSTGKTDAEILADASKGVIPQKGSPEAQRLWELRRGVKK